MVATPLTEKTIEVPPKPNERTSIQKECDTDSKYAIMYFYRAELYRQFQRIEFYTSSSVRFTNDKYARLRKLRYETEKEQLKALATEFWRKNKKLSLDTSVNITIFSDSFHTLSDDSTKPSEPLTISTEPSTALPSTWIAPSLSTADDDDKDDD